jgi:hypothetical protein
LRVKVINGEVEGKIRRFESKGREKSRQLRSKVDKERDKEEEVTAASGSTIYVFSKRIGKQTDDRKAREWNNRWYLMKGWGLSLAGN